MLTLTLTLVAFLLPLAYSPGPGNLFFAANGARFGFRATVPATLGYHLATWIVTVGIGLGFDGLFQTFPEVFHVVKLAGAGYVLWLAWSLFRAGALTGAGTAKPARFRDGVILLVLNPKAYVIIALMFTQFLAVSDGDRLLAVLLIATVFTVNNLLAFSLWTLVGDGIARHFRSPQSARRLNMMFGLVLAGVGIWMAAS